MNEPQNPRLLTASLVVAFLWLTIFVFTPGNLYLTNLDGFAIHFDELLSYSLPLFLLATIASTTVLMVFRASIHKALVAVAFALALLLWFQGNILVWQYGLLNGRQIPWEDYWLNGVIDGVLWVSVLSWSIINKDFFYRVARIASASMIVLLSLAMILTADQAQPDGDSHNIKNYAIDESNRNVFSRNRNVILIVLDEFQSDVFREIIEETPSYAEIFQGFTYFRNSLAGSNYTELAVPALLTGRLFDNQSPRSSFLERSFLSDSITTILKREGYLVDVYPWVGWSNESIFFDERVASNLKKIEKRGKGSRYTEKKAKEVLHLYDLTLFRSAPHFIKRHIYNDQQWFLIRIVAHNTPRWVKKKVSTDASFEANALVREASSGIRIERAENVFKFIHLKGAHSPLTVNQDLEYTDRTFEDNRQNYIAQAKASLRSLDEYLNGIREGGIFDDSLIIVTGDHGSGMSKELFFEGPGGAAIESESRRPPYKRNFQEDKARAIPLLLVKRFESGGPLETSDAPVSVMDIPATIISELGMSAKATGLPMFGVDLNSNRTRRYGAFSFSHTTGDYVGSIVLYSVNGDSWLDESWQIEDVFPPPAQ